MVRGLLRCGPLVAVLAGGISCGDSPVRPATTGLVRVTGVVRDFRTDAPVAGAQVVFGPAEARTDSSGRYFVPVAVDEHRVSVDDEFVGLVRPRDRFYRGDLYVRTTGCVSRYGLVRDRHTRRPVAGATVTVLGEGTTTDSTGWFHVSRGCPEVLCIGFNTTSLIVEHPRYERRSMTIGRGFCGVSRVDVELDRSGNR